MRLNCSELFMMEVITLGSIITVQVNRFIDIDFSCLDTRISLDVWVLILDFIGMGAKVEDNESSHKPRQEVDYAHLSGL